MVERRKVLDHFLGERVAPVVDELGELGGVGDAGRLAGREVEDHDLHDEAVADNRFVLVLGRDLFLLLAGVALDEQVLVAAIEP